MIASLLVKDQSGHVAAGEFLGHPVTDECFNTCMPENQLHWLFKTLSNSET